MKLRELALWPGIVALVVAALLVELSPNWYAKESLHGIYVLEWLTFCWILSIAPLLNRLPAREGFTRLAIPIGFLGLGLGLVIQDAISSGGDWRILLQTRYLQKCLLFVYPFIWIGMGWVTRTLSPTGIRWVLAATFLGSVIPNLAGQIARNLGVGSLLSVAAVYAWLQWIEGAGRRPIAQRAATFALCMILSIGACLPFWLMVFDSVQRTSLIIATYTFLLGPFVLIHQNIPSWKKGILSILLSTLILGGLAAIARIPEKTHYGRVSNFTNSFIKGDDLPASGKDGQSAGRFRAFCWRQTLKDWREAPIFGIGFKPEVPSHLHNDAYPEGVPNSGGYEFPGSPPIIGAHNSYLTVLARMGVIGFALIVTLWIVWFQAIWSWSRTQKHLRGLYQLEALLLFFIPLNGAFHALFNIGFESPPRTALTWLFLGAGLALRSPFAHLKEQI